MQINVRGLSYRYMKADQPAIEGLEFAVEPGEIFGFLGPSAAGKSTTQKVLIGLLRDYTGHVQILGRDLASWGSDLYERVGVSFEFPNHFGKLTGTENLRYFGSLYQAEVHAPQKLLELVGLQNDGDLLVSQYSKGMKNRLSVARALVHDPDLLFLDEPTAGLDPVNARRIKDLVAEQRDRGKTIFLCTHDMTVAEELCDRIAFIVDGRISLIESPRALKLQYGRRVVRVEYGADGNGQVQEFPLEGLASNEQFLAVLEQPVKTIHSQEATLERIFIEVTGRKLQ
ncbi:MAG: ABC transporter ATP-binding protein [Anaerolineales bacterium]|nr:ABC transporter ATP-binding protein [Anaerolineales bacterium]